ncbi:MAG: STN domain-containing protein [Planctomycetia bacterium]|nr:STN domain-containing protein [Planctomycetia bacterium]
MNAQNKIKILTYIIIGIITGIIICNFQFFSLFNKNIYVHTSKNLHTELNKSTLTKNQPLLPSTTENKLSETADLKLPEETILSNRPEEKEELSLPSLELPELLPDVPAPDPISVQANHHTGSEVSPVKTDISEALPLIPEESPSESPSSSEFLLPETLDLPVLSPSEEPSGDTKLEEMEKSAEKNTQEVSEKTEKSPSEIFDQNSKIQISQDTNTTVNSETIKKTPSDTKQEITKQEEPSATDTSFDLPQLTWEELFPEEEKKDISSAAENSASTEKVETPEEMPEDSISPISSEETSPTNFPQPSDVENPLRTKHSPHSPAEASKAPILVAETLPEIHEIPVLENSSDTTSHLPVPEKNHLQKIEIPPFAIPESTSDSSLNETSVQNIVFEARTEQPTQKDFPQIPDFVLPVETPDIQTSSINESPKDGENTVSHLSPETASQERIESDEKFLVSEPIILQHRQTDIRRLIQFIQERSGAQIYTSVEVQGNVNCNIRSQDVDEIFQQLLGTTSFGYIREGKQIFIGRRGDIHQLPVKISEKGIRRVIPKEISLDFCERFIRAHLSSQGSCIRKTYQDQECLIVQDMELALLEIDRMLELIDIPPVNYCMDTFIFERTSQNKNLLNLETIAENANAVLQQYREPVSISPEAPKKNKTLWNFISNKKTPLEEKKEKEAEKRKKTEETQKIYTLSHRMDTFMIHLEDNKETKLLTARQGISRRFIPGSEMSFPFTLHQGEKKQEYVLKVNTPKELIKKSITEQASDQDIFSVKQPNLSEGILLQITCASTDEKNERGKNSLELSAPIDMNSAIIFQGKVATFQDTTTFWKRISPTKHNSEIIVMIILREENPSFPPTDFTNSAIRYLIMRCQQLGKEIAEQEKEDHASLEIAKDFILLAKHLQTLRNSPTL